MIKYRNGLIQAIQVFNVQSMVETQCTGGNMSYWLQTLNIKLGAKLSNQIIKI